MPGDNTDKMIKDINNHVEQMRAELATVTDPTLKLAMANDINIRELQKAFLLRAKETDEQISELSRRIDGIYTRLDRLEK